MATSSKVTPSRQQYLDIKAQHPDAIVFFRLGDFYETFDEDAEIAARELDLVLTSRPQGKNQRTPMAGVPHHAAENEAVAGFWLCEIGVFWLLSYSCSTLAFIDPKREYFFLLGLEPVIFAWVLVTQNFGLRVSAFWIHFPVSCE